MIELGIFFGTFDFRIYLCLEERGIKLAQHKIDYTRENGLPIVLTTIDKLISWGRSNSLWAMSYGLACCAIEMMATGAGRYDFDRFGTIFRGSAKHSDVMINRRNS